MSLATTTRRARPAGSHVSSSTKSLFSCCSPPLQTGEWKHTAGEYPGAGFESDKGIQTSQDARFYSLTAPLTGELNNKDKDLIMSYTVKHEQNIDCGGAYLKVRGTCESGLARVGGAWCAHGRKATHAVKPAG